MSIFHWIRNRRRKKLLAEPFPPAWQATLDAKVKLFGLLPPKEQQALRNRLRIFIAEKDWEGCGGLKMTDEIRVVIAAQACVLALGVADFYFERVETVLVYPSEWVPPPQFQRQHGGVVTEDSDALHLGEHWQHGPVILAWDQAEHDATRPQGGFNVVFHEFAHHLDGLNGFVDGMPPLDSPSQERNWLRVTEREYDKLVEMSEAGRATLLDEYGASSMAEFFAVSTECFFTRPVAMQRRHAELFELLAQFYKQDPRPWFNERPAGGETSPTAPEDTSSKASDG
jgi:Mlc titration factor MtfA (ptsG expression regulator)